MDRVIGVHRGVEQHADAAFGDHIGEEIVHRRGPVRRRGQVGGNDRFEQPLVTAPRRIGHLQINQGPVDLAGLYLSADLSQAAVIGFQADLNPRFRSEGLVIRLLAGAGVGASPRDQSERFITSSRAAPTQAGQQNDYRRVNRRADTM